jgi:N-acetylglucosaminyldiphosphoundecaprenol N-acetyl-beta-D-mannosaminyltransferase
MTPRDRALVVSLRPDVLDEARAIARVEEILASGGGYVCFSTVHMVMEGYDDPKFAEIVNAADMIVTDGMPIVWMQRRQGKRSATRVRANDLMMSLCREAEEKNWRVGFYGGKQEVIDAIVERAKRDFPSLKVVYAVSPPFRPLTVAEDTAITREIDEAAPDLLFVGLGCPKQERWMNEHARKLKCVMLGVGASFDFFAGNVKESPPWLGRLGLEWLHRLAQEPKRLWRRYLILNPRFMVLAAKQLVTRANSRS